MFNLPFLCAAIIAFIIVMYVILDGFDLGIGILYPFVKNHQHRDIMMQTMSPIWDGNETWMVLGAASLYGTFPVVYSTMLPNLYLPILVMLAALIFRGVALEFRFKSMQRRFVWDTAFAVGSILVGFCQGLILGTFVQGQAPLQAPLLGFIWLTPFTIFTGFAVIVGYALLGAGWLIGRTENDLQATMYKVAKILLIILTICLLIVSAWSPFIAHEVMERWFKMPYLFYLAPLPIATAICIAAAFYSLYRRFHWWPFILSIGVFIFSYIGFAISIWPYLIPYKVTIWEAAAPHSTQVFYLVGVVILLPVLLAYTAYSYYVFRGKVKHDPHGHY